MKQFFSRIYNNKEYRNIGIIFCITAFIFLCFRYCLPLVLPFVFALFTASLLRPLVDFLCKKFTVADKTATAIIILLGAILLVTLGRLFLRSLFSQLESISLYLPFYEEQFRYGLDTCCTYIDSSFHLKTGMAFHIATDTLTRLFSDFQSTLLPALTANTTHAVKYTFSSLLSFFIMLYAAFCMLADYPKLLTSNSLAQKIKNIWEQLFQLLTLYLRTEGILALLQALICAIALRILHYPYYLPLGLLIGIIDALPVFGCGTILVPWSILQFFLGTPKMAIGLLLLWGICTINRQLLEPRLLGQKLGMSTLLTLFLMYIGYQLFGILGFVLGPVGFLLGKELYHNLHL